jgi:helix-turn-helix protein
MLVYSGMDSHAIENMLNIPQKQLDIIYDKILKLGLGEVVTIRREIQLTTKGVRYISDATKSQTN